MQTNSVERHEDKYLLPLFQAIQVQQHLSLLCQPDIHNSGSAGYSVRSLYFDNLENTDYESKLAGTERRKKIRLRIYNTFSDSVKLELKEKHGDLQRKTSLQISRKEAEQLIDGDFSILLQQSACAQDALKIYMRMNSHGISHPVSLIEYDRCAYTLPCNNTRITIDRNIRCAEYYNDLFSMSPPFRPVLTQYAVLEVKYNGRLVMPVADLLSILRPTRCSVSKYCMGRPLFYDYTY